MTLGKPLDKKALLREMRGSEAGDTEERDRILGNALRHLSERGIEYVPLALEEDIQDSYEDDDIDTFRETVRGWMVALAKAAA